MPGELFPTDRPRPTDSQAERFVYDVLKRQLPAGWRAWHSVRVRAANGWEGEGDFVLGVPGRGLLVLEVKGGRVALVDGHWLQNGKEMKKPPRDQAQGFVRSLAREVERRGGGKVPFAVACAFPDVEFSAGPEAGDVAGAVLGRRQLQYFAESIAAFADALLPKRPAPPDAAWMPVVQRLWGETWVPRVRLEDVVEDARRELVALDEEQLEILDVAGENARALVEGAAGTGKTVVARELCRRRAAAGQRVLYVCFTEALAGAIERQFRERGADGVRAVAVRQYARELLGEEGPAQTPESHAYWETVSRRAHARLRGDQRPDVVVVDEGQDLASADWDLVGALAWERDLWVFHDPRQAFWIDRGLPGWVCALDVKLKLKRQQRSPPAIAAFADLFAGAAAAAQPASCLELIEVEEANVVDRLAATLDGLVKDGVRPRDIAVISLSGQRKCVLPQLDRVGAHPLARSDAPGAHEVVVADTFLRFKGLERPFVVIAELDGGLGHQFDTRMHIALTRATVGVKILCSPDAAKDPRLGALRGA